MAARHITEDELGGYWLAVDPHYHGAIAFKWSAMPQGAVPLFETEAQLHEFMRPRSTAYNAAVVCSAGGIIEAAKRRGHALVLNLREVREGQMDVIRWTNLIEDGVKDE